MNRLQGGYSEILNWIVATGALEALEMKVLNYIPGYRSEVKCLSVRRTCGVCQPQSTLMRSMHAESSPGP